MKDTLWVGFLSLEIWHESKKIALETCALIEVDALSRKWSIKDQITRSVFSISSNIAEWSARGGKKEFKYFLKIAKGSCGELISQLLVLQDINIVDNEKLLAIVHLSSVLLKRIWKLIWSLNK